MQPQTQPAQPPVDATPPVHQADPAPTVQQADSGPTVKHDSAPIVQQADLAPMVQQADSAQDSAQVQLDAADLPEQAVAAQPQGTAAKSQRFFYPKWKHKAGDPL